MYRVIIAGSRDFDDYNAVIKNIKNFIKDYNINSPSEIEIISGCARGADTLGIRLADKNNITCKKFLAQWDIYGKSAGYKRNIQMAEYAAEEDGVLFAFWDGESKGTKHMIDTAKKQGLQVFVITDK